MIFPLQEVLWLVTRLIKFEQALIELGQERQLQLFHWFLGSNLIVASSVECSANEIVSTIVAGVLPA